MIRGNGQQFSGYIAG